MVPSARSPANFSSSATLHDGMAGGSPDGADSSGGSANVATEPPVGAAIGGNSGRGADARDGVNDGIGGGDVPQRAVKASGLVAGAA